MKHRSLRILACAGALLSLLAFTAPAHAAGWTYGAPESGILQAAWEWVTGLWSPANPAQGHRHGKRSSGIDPDGLGMSDRGSGIDPDGLQKSDRSAGIDPDGSPNSATTSTCTANCDPNG
jgi:hypothetical protein